MSNVFQIGQNSQDEEIRFEQASDWIARLDRELSSAEKQAFQVWLNQDIDNIKLLMEMAQMWDKMDNLGRLSDLFPQNSNKDNVQDSKKQPSAWLMSLAASVFVAISFYLGNAYFDVFNPNNQSAVTVMQVSYQTGVGESNTIKLPDNSTLVLNTNSFVQVKYTQDARLIELQRGEIHIDVAHDLTRPLSVLAQGKIIQAVGTSFNVEVKNDLVELIVTDGKVLVAKKKNISLNSEIAQIAKKLPQNSMAISKGEKVELDISSNTLEKVVKIAPTEIAASLSWRKGNLTFRGESLEQAMAEISRYTNIEFELANDEKLKQVRVAGMFKTGDVVGLLNVLDQNFNISYKRINADKIILKYKG